MNAPQRRTASLNRQTKETNISLTLNIDGRGKKDISTGIGFLDHMLSHVTIHGLFDLQLHAEGDLHIDVHHTVEDVALALGRAFDQALGDRSGIQRISSVVVPMDESLAEVAVDLSGRPYAVIHIDWSSQQVGGIPTTLFPHFLESFAIASRANLHASVRYGQDDHHKAEALFKAFGRALDAAARIDPRRAGNIPSTKGTLSA